MCYISRLASYACFIFLAKSFPNVALLPVIRSQQSCDIFLITVFKLQGLHNCCIRIVILIINILLPVKHMLDNKGGYTMNISEGLNLVKEESLDPSVESKAS